MKKEVVVLCDGQLDVFEVLEDIEKNGLKPEPAIKPFVYEGRPSTPPGARPRVVAPRPDVSVRAYEVEGPKPLWNR